MSNSESEINRILAGVPEPEALRKRLAVVTTEAALLRSQLRVSKRVQNERVRLRQLVSQPTEVAHASC